ncbi:conserved hypothetical protein [Paecilomyces variotii No. 5]|uniref:Peptidase C45 hydrolase domain-containing protein n=1 Tax=Byssochlamys spectabilis (strain No. 5 / NBRC 109023) TaxID=1356009 RepID=V5HTM9_BYSSN|nr:conserved hypothetical protein [Paecilomyces variotii No. 5]
MKKIWCSGTTYEIGYTHGVEAAGEIKNAIIFYADLFMKHSRLDWSQVKLLARSFHDTIKTQWPQYHKEMEGIANGAKCELLDIIALNVRTEIVFGKFSDGCTSLYYGRDGAAYLGQNWDWMEAQKSNLIQLTIIQDGLPTIKMITEAGIIGKIGLNSAGVGVCFNAIRAKGLDMTRLPAHFGLRVALESTSALGAVEKLERIGLASSAHILIGDPGTAVGLEFTSTSTARVAINPSGFLVHTNHMLLQHANICEPKWLDDSPVRLHTVEEKISQAGGRLSWEHFNGIFEDETNYPCSINRAAEGSSDLATLFNIVMDLGTKKAIVRIGRPVQGNNSEEKVLLQFP